MTVQSSFKKAAESIRAFRNELILTGSGTDKTSSALGRLRAGANNGSTAMGKLKGGLGDAGGSLDKSKSATDKFKTSLDKLKSSADKTKAALKDVKNQAEAVEKSVGKAGKNADKGGKSMGSLGKGLKGAGRAQKGLNLAMAASPFGLVMTLLTPLIAQFVNMDKVTALVRKGLTAAWSHIKSSSQSAAKILGPLFKGVVNGFLTPTRMLVRGLNVLIGGLNHVKFKVPGWVPVIGGKGFAVVKITSGTVGGGGLVASWTIPKLASLKGVWHLGFTVDTRAGAVGGNTPATVYPRLTAPDGEYVTPPTAPYTFSDAASVQPPSELYQISLKTDVAVECLQVTDRSWPDLDSYTAEEWEQKGRWAKGAVLDDATVPLYDVPKISGSQWDALTEIARATMSTAEFDEQGVFRWRGPGRFRTVPARPDLTVTTRRDIAALTVSEEIDACRNHCEQPYQDWTGISHTYSDTVVREVRPGGWVEVAYAIAEEELDVGPLQIEDDVAPVGGHRVRFGSAAAGGTSVKGAVTVSSRRDGPNYLVRFANHGTASVWTVTKDGKPSVQIVPQKRTGDPRLRSFAWYNTTSQAAYGKQVYQAPATDWVQQQQVASDLSHAMLDAGRYPVPVLGEVEVLHDPRIQLGDVVRVVDTSGATLDTLAWVVGIRTTCQAGAAPQQTLTLRGTSYNGVPTDSGLTPDPPVDPEYGNQRTYALIDAQNATLDALTTSRITYRELLKAPGGAA
ncbi:hypothetical protein [Streptomyces mirabilis]|uniref:hypothetical protein n=1 Tax=Streptomyces mirabilis TaxID=68239 RepID=UPI00339F72E9